MAYNIMALSEVTFQRGPKKGTSLALRACHNGAATSPPPVGSMLIWGESYDKTGHVAIITQVGDGFVRVAEQNFEDWLWEDGQDYARELKLSLSRDGRHHTVHDEYEVLGWMV